PFPGRRTSHAFRGGNEADRGLRRAVALRPVPRAASDRRRVMDFPRHRFKKAWEWRELMAAKKTTPSEITEEYLARAKSDDTNSFLLVMEEEARSMAKAASGSAGALAGI